MANPYAPPPSGVMVEPIDRIRHLRLRRRIVVRTSEGLQEWATVMASVCPMGHVIKHQREVRKPTDVLRLVFDDPDLHFKGNPVNGRWRDVYAGSLNKCVEVL